MPSWSDIAEKKENPESDPGENHAKVPIIISLPFCSFNRAPVPRRRPTSFSRHSFDIQRRELAISVHWAPCCAPTLQARLRWRYAIAEENVLGTKNRKKNKKRERTASEIEMAVYRKQDLERMFWEAEHPWRHLDKHKVKGKEWKNIFAVPLACVHIIGENAGFN